MADKNQWISGQPPHNCPSCSGGWKWVKRIAVSKDADGKPVSETLEVKEVCTDCGGMGVIGG